MKAMKVNPIPMRILKDNKNPIIVFQGASSSGKTYSILQFIILKCLSDWKNKTIDILRRTTPALKRSVMKDFFDILLSIDAYEQKNHNKTDSYYVLNGNLIRFYSSDEEQKLRGLRRDILYLNEVLEFKKIDVMQVLMRTNELTLMDYNPSETYHWVYDEILTRKDITFHKSTYKENEFLSDKIADELENLKNTDENLYRIYAQGEKGTTQDLVFNNWEYAEKEFKDYEGELLFGQDFGYNHPSTLIQVKYNKKQIIIDELLYQTELTSSDLINEMNKLKLDKNNKIIADGSRPEMIEEIYKAGYNVYSSSKGSGSVMRGINFMKKHKIIITKNSLNVIKEFKSYRWKKDKDDKIRDTEPVDAFNHCIDAVRYALEEKSEDLPPVIISKVRW